MEQCNECPTRRVEEFCSLCRTVRNRKNLGLDIADSGNNRRFVLG